MTDYPAVLSALYPGAQWSLDGDDYEGLVWLEDGPVPSQAELDEAWPQVQYDAAYGQVEHNRYHAYAGRGGADSTFFKWQRGDATEQEWLDEVEAVKDAHPYPDAP